MVGQMSLLLQNTILTLVIVLMPFVPNGWGNVTSLPKYHPNPCSGAIAQWRWKGNVTKST